jgi:lipopolysaccharide export system protein LptA
VSPAAVIALLALVSSEAPAMASLKGSEEPLDFRCDNMQVFSKPNRTVCKANVVVRRGDLLVCCVTFEGFADDAWGWQRFVCSENVRARRADETIWSDKAEFVLETNELVLTGRPRLARGKSVLEGERVVVDVKTDHARIEKPRGRFASANAPTPTPVPPAIVGPLPAVCPLPPLVGR